MKLRRYAPADQAALIEVWFESWRSVGLERPVVTKADLAARAPRDLAGRWTVTIAEEDSRILGFVALCRAERRLDQLFVLPSLHGRGVGLALFEAAKDQMPAGFWLSTQTANHRARQFYERRGMRVDRVEADRVFYEWAANPA